ncbi:MAG: DUF2721 domain-containing protein [Bacteroidota bacterium]
MHEVHITAIEAIQAILAPALGISAVGLLLLGLNSRYSNIMNRIRLITEERRKYLKLISENVDLSYSDNLRYMSITNQSGELLVRSRYVRNAILCMQGAVALFVLTSAGIGLNLFLAGAAVEVFPLMVFIAGMLCVFAGIVFAALEVHRSYKIILLEVTTTE